MTAAVIFSILRFALSLLLAAGGIAAIWFGYKLFMDGVGTAKAVDKLDLKRGEHRMSIAGLSVGGALMLTSSVWGYFSYSSAAKFEMAGDIIRITGVPYKDVIGAPVFARTGKEKIGEISDLFVNANSDPTGVVVNVDQGAAGSKKVLLNAKDFDFKGAGKHNAAQVNMTAEQVIEAPSFDALTTATRPNS